MNEKDPLMQVSFRIPSKNRKALRLMAKQANLNIPRILEPVVTEYAESRRPYSIERIGMLVTHLLDGTPFIAPNIEYPRVAYEDPVQVGIRLPFQSFLVLKSIDCTDDVLIARQIEPVVIEFSEQNTSVAVQYLQTWFPSSQG